MTTPLTRTRTGVGEAPVGRSRAPGRRAARRVLAVLAVVTLIVATPALSAAYSLRQATVYGGSIDVLFSPAADRSDGAAQRQMFTQLVILRSPTVLEPVAPLLGTSVAQLEAAVDAEVVEQSNIVRITVAGSDPASATRAAQAIADEYVRVAPDTSPGSQVYELHDARPLDRPLRPDPVRAASAGAIAGILLGTLAALLLLRPRLARRADRAA
jgi:capsular polysaccharide biosynthesis protein